MPFLSFILSDHAIRSTLLHSGKNRNIYCRDDEVLKKYYLSYKLLEKYCRKSFSFFSEIKGNKLAYELRIPAPRLKKYYFCLSDLSFTLVFERITDANSIKVLSEIGQLSADIIYSILSALKEMVMTGGYHGDVNSGNIFFGNESVSFIDFEYFIKFHCSPSAAFSLLCAHFWSNTYASIMSYEKYRVVVENYIIKDLFGDALDNELFKYYSFGKVSSIMRKARIDFVAGKISRTELFEILRTQPM